MVQYTTFDDRDQNFDPVNLAQFVNNAEDLIKVYYLHDRRIENYSYDAGGNRITESIEQRENQTKDYIYYPNSNRLMTNDKFAFVYDATGNLLEKGSSYKLQENNSKVSINPNEGEHWRYHYDLLNRLVKVEQNGEVVATYKYDEAGLRLSKQTKEQTTYYIFNLNGQVIYEQEDTDYTEYLYVLNRHFARIDGNLITEERTTYFYHTDHLGSTVLVTDELGQTVWSSEYTPFGQVAKDDPSFNKAIKFTGKDLDLETGLYYFNARWYDSDIGRFISEDPIKDGLNWYTYAISNPLVYVDPSGLKVFLIHGTFVGTETWEDDFRAYLAKSLKEEVKALEWDGKNSDSSRREEAERLAEVIIKWHKENPDEPIRLVGHSHGGNVAVLLTNLLAKEEIYVETLITIATPVREYVLDEDVTVGKHINVYNDGDVVQAKIGGRPLKFGSAGRTFEGATNVEVPKLTGWLGRNKPLENHSFMHSNKKIWVEYIEPELN